MDRHTNLTLLQRIRDPKDGIAWGEFNYIYGGLLNQWLRRQGVNGEDCNDIAQEVLLAVSQLIQDFQHNGNVGAFRKWLRSVMVYRMRRFIETRRKRKSKVSSDYDALVANLEDDGSRVTEVWNKEHDRHVLLQLLQRVSKQFSEQSLDVFRRVAIMQEDAATVAEEMGIKLGALRVAQHRVMKELRNTAAGLVDLESI